MRFLQGEKGKATAIYIVVLTTYVLIAVVIWNHFTQKANALKKQEQELTTS